MCHTMPGIQGAPNPALYSNHSPYKRSKNECGAFQPFPATVLLYCRVSHGDERKKRIMGTSG